jgi:outer membrane protein
LKRIPALLFFCLAALSIWAQTQPPAKATWTLEECIRYATENNISVRQADLYKRISKNTYLQSKLNLLPTINANAAYNFNFGNSINPTTYTYVQQNSQSFSPNIQANLNLFTGLQQLNTIRKDKFDLMAYSFDYATAVNNTALTVTNLFLQLVVNKELVKVAQKQVDLSQSQLDVQKAKIRAGTMAEASIYDFEAQLARDQASLITQKNSEAISNITLLIALQLPDNTPFDIIIPEANVNSVSSIANTNAHEIYQYALSTQPVIQAAQARVTSSHYSIKVAKGALSPTIYFSAFSHDNWFNLASQPDQITYSLAGASASKPIFSDLSGSPTIVGYDRLQVNYTTKQTPFSDQFKNNLANGFSFNMNIPIFNGWQKMTTIANSKLQYQIQQLNLESAKNSLEKDIYQSYANAKGNAESYNANMKALDASQKAFETTTKRYNAGLATNYDLELSKSNLARAESSAVQSKYNYIFSVKVLDFYQGKPITLN